MSVYEAHDAIDAALEEADRLRRVLKRKTAVQVHSLEERSLVKATALSWFKTHRDHVASTVDADLLRECDSLYQRLLSAADRATCRSRYNSTLKAVREELVGLRVYALIPRSSQVTKPTHDEPPKFDPLISDPRMQSILADRWRECAICLSSGAPLAATVMMGGLLEALLLARVNKEKNKTRVFRAASAPRHKPQDKVSPLKEWSLRHYVDVAHELGWISQSARDVGVVLRDYRNYIHPYKQLSHGVVLEIEDATLLWEICKSIAKQVIKS